MCAEGEFSIVGAECWGRSFLVFILEAEVAISSQVCCFEMNSIGGMNIWLFVLR